MTRQALTVVDVQEDTAKLPWISGMTGAGQQALEAARHKGWLVALP